MASSSSSSFSLMSLPKPNEAERLGFDPTRLPTVEEIGGQDIGNNCFLRSAFHGVMGGGLGLIMGSYVGAFLNPLMQEERTAKQEFIFIAKMMGRRGYHYSKSFAVVFLVYSAAECAVEKAQGKHDITSTIVAGCVTGGTMYEKGGPKAACVGCAGFATLSVLLEKLLPDVTSTSVFPN